MNHIEHLMKKYKDEIVIGTRNIDELLGFLRKKFNILEMPLSKLPSSYLEHCKFNIFNMESTKNRVVSGQKLRFLAYEIVMENQSYISYAPLSKTEKIFVVFETKTESIFSNSSRLFLELFLFRGICQLDYEQKTIMLFDYLTKLDHYHSFLDETKPLGQGT